MNTPTTIEVPHRGFSLLEVLTALTVVAILAAIAVPI